MTRAEKVALAAQLYAEGHGLAVVASRVDVHLTTVRGWLVRAGVERRPVGRPRRCA